MEATKASLDTLAGLQKKLFKLNVVGGSLKADNEKEFLEKDKEAKVLLAEAEAMNTVARKAVKQWNAWLTLNKV